MNKNLAQLLILATFISACSTTKDLPAGQKLYTGGEIDITDKDLPKNEKSLLKSDLQALLRPKPNGKIGPFRFKLWVYQKTRTTKTKGLKHWLNTKFGEPPVLVSAVDLTQNSSILQNRLQNRSYFQAQVTGDTVGKKKVAKAVYTVTTGPSYKYRNIIFPTSKDVLDTAIAATSARSVLKKGDQYNLDAIKAERVRIDARLKEKGFYYFAPENLIVRIDSTIAGHQVDAYVKVKDDVSDRARRVYSIKDIYVYPRYSLRDTALKLDSAEKYRWYHVIDRRHTVRPFVFKNTILLHPGEVYNRTDHNNSLNRFIELGPFKFVRNRFDDVSTADSAKLNAFYFLTQYPRKSLSFDVLGRTTSANYNGTQVNINWRNRNAFKGAEALTVTLFGSTDGQISGQFGGGHALSQVGIQTTLSWPRFISPFNFKADNAYIPRTNLSVGYSIVNRSGLYNLNSFNGSFGYQWKQSVHKSHELNLINVTYVKPASVDTAYTNNIEVTRNPTLKHVIDPQFTIGPSYSYTYTNTTETYRTNTIYYNGRISTSGIISGLIMGADTLAGKSKKLFGSNFNQYIKLENEIRYFHKVGLKSQIAAKFIASAGLPYGNSTILPYSQQFFIGGANSLRGFRARSIGPGGVDPSQYITTNNGFIADQSGDIKLEASLEYRPHLFSIVYGALFADAGNIWNAKPHQAGGTFGPNFLSQIAADVGFGLRFDASVLVLRTDFGFPVLKPFTASNPNVNYDKMVFNLAIGYPF
ncbi:BamA/TamA family outer membrane protein [Mucilaginibacter sp. Bleaf8]|uniref:translocation and assembly module lipoprotein TamL n=1 Tax=Mucilaginibacter sp. Bleaf8 TaxID=2834430 RepID=UPI001BD0483D|nr:BamA/TamA family outer membrane protein [Mucilaginibacter sp. Bleaf8]MBS7564525.1 BamA/TamA family outer membrane protein [Mucilaginibacter sp. Bleaf8]